MAERGRGGLAGIVELFVHSAEHDGPRLQNRGHMVIEACPEKVAAGPLQAPRMAGF